MNMASRSVGLSRPSIETKEISWEWTSQDGPGSSSAGDSAICSDASETSEVPQVQ